MFQVVQVPLWLFVLILAFAAITFASHFLFPSVRWFLRRRMERVVARLNQRLTQPIQPFKLARRADTILRLIYDPEVARAVSRHAAATGVREDVAFQQARRYAREIVPGFSASAYFGIATRAAKWLSTRLYRVRLHELEAGAVDSIDPEATVVYVINHRSNMDYVLVTYLVAERSAVAYAVGEWARVWPFAALIRAMGGYFIRRRSRNPLYRKVLERYVQLATAGGITQAFFPEGGLSLTGRIGAPKLGLLSYIVEGAGSLDRDIVFVPIALNYDRVVEDRILTEAAASGDRRFRAPVPAALAFAARWLWNRITGRSRRFGYAAVSFGRPLSLRAFLTQGRGDPVRRVAEALMTRIGEGVPVLPVPLVATILLAGQGPRGRPELAAELARMAAALTARGIHVRLARGNAEATVAVALDTLTVRRIVTETEAGIAIAPGQEALMRFYAASIAHHLEAPADKTEADPEEAEALRHKVTG